MDQRDLEVFKKMRLSPVVFLKVMWGLTPQPFKNEEIKKKAMSTPLVEWTKEFFIEITQDELFEKKHFSWQQYVVLLSVEKAAKGEASKKISIASGNGIGKTTMLAWLILWFLYCYKESQIPCTANSSQQIHDVLWKEIQKWINRMPSEVRNVYDWQSKYVRINEQKDGKDYSKTWFARASTANKEKPEALSGVHADYVMLIADEASGIPDPIFSAARGVLTGKFVFFICTSNPTRLSGFFRRTHKRRDWQQFTFSTEDTPVANRTLIDDIIEEHGVDSDDYRVFVEGKFPKEESLDEGDYAQLFTDKQVFFTQDDHFGDKKRLGVDPSGEGADKSIWILRDRFKTKIILTEKTSNGKNIASKTATLMDKYDVQAEDVYIDGFGVGMDAIIELERSGHQVNSVILGNTRKPDDPNSYTNKRAENYWRMRKWVRQGGEFYGDITKWEKITTIRYRREETSNKIKIKSKREMRRDGEKSPDEIDAVMVTFDHPEDFDTFVRAHEEKRHREEYMQARANMAG